MNNPKDYTESFHQVCKAKRSYATVEEARRYAKHYRKRIGTKQKPYKCPVCEQWHLTSRNTAKRFTLHSHQCAREALEAFTLAPVEPRRSGTRSRGPYFVLPEERPEDATLTALFRALLQTPYTY